MIEKADVLCARAAPTGLPAVPWNLVGALISLGLFVLEVAYWQRRMRAAGVQTGVENLVGAVGTVTERLAPVGQIRVLGAWEARSTGQCRPAPPSVSSQCRGLEGRRRA